MRAFIREPFGLPARAAPAVVAKHPERIADYAFADPSGEVFPDRCYVPACRRRFPLRVGGWPGNLAGMYEVPGDTVDDAALVVLELADCVRVGAHYFAVVFEAHHNAVLAEVRGKQGAEAIRLIGKRIRLTPMSAHRIAST